jgi:cytochrome b561
MIRDHKQGFGLISILFHWISAIGIITLLGTGLYVTSIGYRNGTAFEVSRFHYALAVLIFFVFVVRLLWRLTNKTPRTLTSSTPLKVSIYLSKLFLYVLTFALMVSGYILCTSEGQSLNVFGWFEFPSLMLFDTPQVGLASYIHLYGSWIMIGVIAVHLLGALYHHFFKKDKTLVRMIKPTSTTDV